MKKRKYIMRKKFVIYVKKDLVLMITIENTIRSEIILIILETIEGLLIVFVI